MLDRYCRRGTISPPDMNLSHSVDRFSLGAVRTKCVPDACRITSRTIREIAPSFLIPPTKTCYQYRQASSVMSFYKARCCLICSVPIAHALLLSTRCRRRSASYAADLYACDVVILDVKIFLRLARRTRQQISYVESVVCQLLTISW